MGAFVINSGGLGDAGQTCFGLPLNLSASEISLCDSSAYWILPECWCLSRDAWTQAGSLTPIPASSVAAPGVPSIVTTNPNQVVPDTTGQAAQDLSNAALSQTQGNVLDFVQGVTIPPDTCQYFNMSCTTLALIGAGLFGAVLLLTRLR